MNYEQLETDILTRLQAKLDGNRYDMAIMPDNDAQYTAALQKPKVWIAYAGSTFDQVNRTPKIVSTGPTVQQEVATIELTIQGNKRRGDHAVYNLIRLIQKALVGYSTSQCGKLYQIEVRPHDRQQNVWDYKMMFGGYAHSVQDVFEDDVDGANITQITLDDNYLDEEVIIP